MISQNLENLARMGKLKKQAVSRTEFDGLIRSGRARLTDVRTRKPSPRLLPQAFGGTEVHRTSYSFRLTHHTLEALGNRKGLLGLIFNKSQAPLFAGGAR